MSYRERFGGSSTPADPDLPPSLAGAEVGDEVHVNRILLSLVRTVCREQGIAVGDRSVRSQLTKRR